MESADGELVRAQIDDGVAEAPAWVGEGRRPRGRQVGVDRHEERLQGLSLRPREYVERQIRVTPYPTEDVGWITEQVGPDICMFSTDFPHVEGGRRPFERFERSLGDASEASRHRFYAENFVDLMGKGLPAL